MATNDFFHLLTEIICQHLHINPWQQPKPAYHNHPIHNDLLQRH